MRREVMEMQAPRVELVPRVDKAGEEGKIAFKMPSRGRKAVTALFSTMKEEEVHTITEADLAPLPTAVQQYLRFTGVVGQKSSTAVRITQSGQFFMGAKRGWLPFTAVEYFNAQDPGFVWVADLRLSPTLPVIAVDRYVRGEGQMKGTLLGLIPVVKQQGPELDQASLMRYLNEMMWFPAEMLRDYIAWEAVDAASAIIKIEHRGLRAQALLKFDGQGRLLDFVAERHSLEGKKLVPRTWRTPITRYASVQGMELPLEGEALYERETGPEAYIKARLTSIDTDALKRMIQ
jgi:hypothetical protein